MQSSDVIDRQEVFGGASGKGFRCVALVALLGMLSACATPLLLAVPESQVFAEQSLSGEEESEAFNGPVDLKSKAIVVFRGEYRAPNSEQLKSLSLVFTTQPLESPYAGSVLRGNSFYNSAHKMAYVSAENAFFAIAVEPGTYRYIWNGVGDPIRVVSRFSPTRRIEFSVQAGEAIYVGDLSVNLNDWDVYARRETGRDPVWRYDPFVLDYRFVVEQDVEAARRFYDALDLSGKPSLQVRPMTNERMPVIEKYTKNSCNRIWVVNSGFSRICR